MWFAGIDWADRHHDTVVIDEAGHKVAQLRVAHTPEGVHKLVSFLREIAPLDQLACILETNHGLLISALLEAGLALYPVNPKTLDLRRLDPDSPAIAELKALTRDQDRLIQMQTRLVNQLTACLKDYYPAALQLFTKLQQHSALLFLQTYPTPEMAQASRVEQLAGVLKQARHPKAAQVAPKIYETLHQPHLAADAVTIRTKSRLMLALVAQLLPLLEQIAAYDKEISALFLKHEDNEVWSSLPGAGKRLAPRLLAEWGDDRQRYADTSSIQALVGTSPVPFESGNYATVHRRFACIKPLRNVLHQFAWQSIQQEAWAKDYYDRKRKEGKSHSMAVRALANVWLRISFAMWVKQEPYQRTTFVAAQRLHACRAAEPARIPPSNTVCHNRGKTPACFLSFNQAYLVQTTQASWCQGKRSGLIPAGGVVHCFMLD